MVSMCGYRFGCNVCRCFYSVDLVLVLSCASGKLAAAGYDRPPVWMLEASLEREQVGAVLLMLDFSGALVAGM